MTTTHTIKNEEDAWALLKKTIEDGISEEPFELVFENWPVLEFKLTGDKFDSSLTIKVMQSFIDLQQKLNRAYAQIKYNKPSALGLTAAEKEELEILVHVEKGSSIFQVDLQAALETFVTGVSGKMTGPEIVATVLGVGLIYGGVTCTKAYFDHQRETKQIETSTFLSEQETKRFEIFAQAMQKQPALQPAYADAEDYYNKMLKGAAEASTFEIGGQQISQEVAQELTRPTRSRAAEMQLNGLYRILKVDSSKPEGFYIGVRFEEDGRTFTAKLEDKWIFRKEANLEVLKTAEWEKQSVYLKINAKEVRGQITQASILDVGEETQL